MHGRPVVFTKFHFLLPVGFFSPKFHGNYLLHTTAVKCFYKRSTVDARFVKYIPIVSGFGSDKRTFTSSFFFSSFLFCRWGWGVVIVIVVVVVAAAAAAVIVVVVVVVVVVLVVVVVVVVDVAVVVVVVVAVAVVVVVRWDMYALYF